MIPVFVGDFNFVDQCFFIDELASNLNLENMISIYISDFSRKKWPKFAKFERENFLNTKISDKFR
jgi:hypothetical protein